MEDDKNLENRDENLAGDARGRVPAEHPKGGAAGGKSPAGPALYFR